MFTASYSTQSFDAACW